MHAKRASHLLEWMWFDLRELVLHVVGVHRPDLLASRGAEHFDDLDKLIDARLAWKQGLPEHQLSHHTSSGPDIYSAHQLLVGDLEIAAHTDLGGVICCAKDQFRCAVVT